MNASSVQDGDSGAASAQLRAARPIASPPPTAQATMTTSDGTTIYDPTATATSLANAYTASNQALIDTQSNTVRAKAAALTQLQGGLQSLGSTLSSLSGKNGLSQMSATLPASAAGNATASATGNASPGSYALFVEQVATNQQIAFKDLPAVEALPTGKITLYVANGQSFEVEMSTADTDGNGTLSYSEIARAINTAKENDNHVTAMVTTVNGAASLVLSAGASGEEGDISLGTDEFVDERLRAALNNPPQELVASQNAIVWLGGQGTGMKIEQGSNIVNTIDGVTLNLTAPQAPGSAPMTLTVAPDSAATTANVQGFVDGYNTLRGMLDGLLKNSSENNDGGPLASDSSIKSLRDRLASMLRQDFGGRNLRDIGGVVDREGRLSISADKMRNALARDPSTLDRLFGKTATGPQAGLLGNINAVVKQWTDSGTGLLKQRQDSISTQQKALDSRQTKLDESYKQVYSRYLKQFSDLKGLQANMSQTTGMLKALSQDSK